MQTRKLGNTGLELTTIGLGTWAIGGSGWQFAWGPQDKDEAVEAAIKAVDLGINWIDTAPVYGNGKSEELVGRALKILGLARRPIVATKFGRVFQQDGTIQGILKPDSLRAECEASLRRLDVDAIDLYQMHWPDPDNDIEEAWSTMVDLKDEGKVRHIGVSNFNIDQMKRLQRIHPIASLQPPYNMIVRGAEEDLLAFCTKNNIGVVAYSPMCKGLLTGAFTKERAAALSDEDHRSRDPKFTEPQLSIHLQLVESQKTIAERNGKTLAELSIAWILRRPEVSSAIVGARRPSQIEGTAPASDWILSEQDIREIDQLLSQHARSLSELGAVSTGRV